MNLSFVQPMPSTSSRFDDMTVVVAAVSSASKLSGVPRHGVNLARCLLAQTAVRKVHLLVAPWQVGSIEALLPDTDRRLELHSVPVDRSALGRNLWYYRRLPALASSLDADIVHLAYPVPVHRRAFRCPVVVTLHDLYPYDIPENFGFPKVAANRLILRQCLGAVDSIACVSESTLRRLDIIAPTLALHKSRVVYNCVEEGPAISADSPLPRGSEQPFLLCVAQHRRNKNIALALEVFRRLIHEDDLTPKAQLVIVGAQGPETAALQHQIRRAGISSNVLLLDGLTDPQLAWCYAHCELLLAPSLFEGFGLPIVEAMFHRCRIVCSGIPVFREIGGTYCHYAGPEGPPVEAFLHATRTALRSHRFRPINVGRFSAAAVGSDYVRLYADLRSMDPACHNSAPCHPLSELERGTP